MTVSIDPNAGATASAGSSSNTTIAATISTTNPNDIIVVVFTTYTNQTNGAQPPCSAKVTSTSGLNFGCRTRQTYVTSIASHLMTTEIWWAPAPNALTSEVVTCSLLPAGITCFESLHVFAVSGADTVQPWDTNASLPAAVNVAGSGGSGSHTVTGISTDSTSPFLIGILANQSGFSGTKNADTGWTKIKQSAQSSTAAGLNTEYQAASGAQSNLSQNVWANWGTITTNYTAIVDAIVPAPASPWTGPKYVNEAVTTFSTVLSVAATIPSNLVNGRLLLGMVSQTAITQTPTWPAGWTVVNTVHGTSQTGQIAWRVVDGTEGATVTVSGLGNAGGGIVKIVQFSGTSNNTPMGNSTIEVSHNTASIPDNPVTSSRTNSMGFLGVDIGSPYVAPTPNKWTPDNGLAVTSPGLGGFSSYTTELPVNGTTTPSIAMTLANAVDWLAFVVEVRAPTLPVPKVYGQIIG